MYKILITGSTGFVGSYLLNKLKENNFIISELNLRTAHPPFAINADVIIHLAGKAHDFSSKQEINDYYVVNTNLTCKVFDSFIQSKSRTFIYLSSVKAVADIIAHNLVEEDVPNPLSHYGKSKLYAERYIQSKNLPEGKMVYILRPSMIHGPGNKGNLNLLYKFVNNGMPWPLGRFDNSRSYTSLDNLCFIIKELIERFDISSGVYNVSDDEPISTNDLIKLISQSLNRKARILFIPKKIVYIMSRIGDLLRLPFNSDRLIKLTGTYIVNNTKIKSAIGKPFPLSSIEGLLKTFHSF